MDLTSAPALCPVCVSLSQTLNPWLLSLYKLLWKRASMYIYLPLPSCSEARFPGEGRLPCLVVGRAAGGGGSQGRAAGRFGGGRDHSCCSSGIVSECFLCDVPADLGDPVAASQASLNKSSPQRATARTVSSLSLSLSPCSHTLIC